MNGSAVVRIGFLAEPTGVRLIEGDPRGVGRLGLSCPQVTKKRAAFRKGGQSVRRFSPVFFKTLGVNIGSLIFEQIVVIRRVRDLRKFEKGADDVEVQEGAVVVTLGA